MICILLSNLIGILQLVFSLVLGIVTIIVYFKIASISSDSSEYLNELAIKNNLFFKLNSDLDRIVDFTIKYPYFDDPEYKNQYKADLQSEGIKKRARTIRYNAFAIMNYNFVEDLYKYYEGDEEKMEEYCDFKELITNHRNYWYNLNENEKNGYHKIKSLIERIIADFENAK
jgi:hypothetical protein